MQAVLCGLSPEVVMTLQAMDIEIGGVQSARSLEEALEHLGVYPASDEGARDRDRSETDGDNLTWDQKT